MARIYPLFSSSKGNCIYFGDDSCGILIDCGVSCKRICEALDDNGISPNVIKAVFITHTHSDHVKGLAVFLKKYRLPVYAQQVNLNILLTDGKLPENTECHAVDSLDTEICGFKISSFVTHHDTPASCGYRVRCPDGKTAAVCTDLGEITQDVSSGILGADLVLIESNYDRDMLRKSGYPPELKRRIASSYGHLSNDDCSAQLVKLAQNGTVNFVLGHLSEENNTPQAAELAAVRALSPLEKRRDYLLYIAPPCGGKAVVF